MVTEYVSEIIEGKEVVSQIQYDRAIPKKGATKITEARPLKVRVVGDETDEE